MTIDRQARATALGLAELLAGGGSEVLIVETLVFDEGQITCPTNGLNPKWGGCCHALSGNAGRTVVIISYQEKTGTLTPGAHPGSYNGQDAYNDMLVTDESSKHWQRAVAQHQYDGGNKPSGLYARRAGGHGGGGGTNE